MARLIHMQHYSMELVKTVSHRKHPVSHNKLVSLFYQKDKFNKNKDYFNKELYQEIIIEGGNYSYFCNYGLQKNDGTPTIDKIEQWNITAKYIKEFVI